MRKSSVEPMAENSGFASAITKMSGICHSAVRSVARTPRRTTLYASAAASERAR